jgi:hypothetical protein
MFGFLSAISVSPLLLAIASEAIGRYFFAVLAPAPETMRVFEPVLSQISAQLEHWLINQFDVEAFAWGVLRLSATQVSSE